MDLEETKKIIENKIEAAALTRDVRSQIKSYIDQKQNLREGFTETFKPLIESQEAVKTSIDTQQNKLIKQLQDNQLALTEGLNKNRLAITSGFDKMDEVKKWDLQQLPGYEAIEEPEEIEKEEPEEIEKEEPQKSKLRDTDVYMITHRNLNKRLGEEVYPNDDEKEVTTVRDFYEIFIKSPIDTSSYRLVFNQDTNEVFLKDKRATITLEYSKNEMDKHLKTKKTEDLLDSFGLKLPSKYRNKSMEEFQKAFEEGMEAAAKLKRNIKKCCIL